jgi:hypothetical protein
MTESLAAALVAVMMWCTTIRGIRGGIGLGVVSGLAILCRPSLAVGVVLTGAGVLWQRRWVEAVALGGALLLTISPWVVRNLVCFGEPIWATTHGGYTLALANNDAYYDAVVDGPPWAVWGGPGQRRWFEEITDATRELGEPGADRRLRDWALETISRRPSTFLKSVWQRLGHFWSLWPSGAVYGSALRVACLLWTLPFWLLVIAGVVQPASWRMPRWAATCQVVGLCVVHSVYWTDMRMRAPIVPALAILAASGLAVLSGALERSGWRVPSFGGFGRSRAAIKHSTAHGRLNS